VTNLRELAGRVQGDFRRVLLATLFFGAVSGIIASTFNNYLADVHGLDASARGWLELPRELPGFIIFGVVGLLLIRFRESRIAALAMIATGSVRSASAGLLPAPRCSWCGPSSGRW
jgi:hypothetical protein